MTRWLLAPVLMLYLLAVGVIIGANMCWIAISEMWRYCAAEGEHKEGK